MTRKRLVPTEGCQTKISLLFGRETLCVVEKMNCLFLILDATLLLQSVVSSLPAPVNVSVDSHNFHHVLRWDPGPGTPPGTVYNITSDPRGNKPEELLNSKTTSLELLLDNKLEYELTVRAFYNLTLSLKSKPCIFTPFENTHIGPAELSLSGCGNCIQINISMPNPYWRSGIKDLMEFYDPKFIVLWRKAKEDISNSKIVETYDKSITLKNLERGEEYCVQVDTKIRTNTHTLPSTWKCTVTSLVEPRRDSAVLGAGAAILFGVVAILISLFCLYYTGFLGKLQENVPQTLIVALHQGYTLTPETTSTYLISGISGTEKQRMLNNPTASHAVTRDAKDRGEGEEEEENEIHDYLDRDAEISTDESSCSGSNVSDDCKPAASANSRSLKDTVDEPPAAFVQGGLHQDNCNTGGSMVSFVSEECQCEREDCEVTACDSSGNVNLFSVTLAALLVGVEEEQNIRDILMARDSVLTLNDADTQMTETDNQVILALAQPTKEDDAKTGYDGRQARTEEEDDNKEFSGYMAHS